MKAFNIVECTLKNDSGDKFYILSQYLNLKKNQLTEYVMVYFWTLNLIPFILCLVLCQYGSALITIAFQQILKS